MKHIFTLALLAGLAVTAHAKTTFISEENDNVQFDITAGPRVIIALLYLALAAGGVALSYIFSKSKSTLRYCTMAIALYGLFRAIIGFIPDSKFAGRKGICSMFLEIFPGFCYLFAFFAFFTEFGSYLSLKRTEPHGFDTTHFGLLRTVKEVVSKIPSLRGALLLASIFIAAIFCIIGITAGGNVEPVSYHIYFTYNHAIFTSGILLVMLVIFGIMYPRKRIFIGCCAVYPILRLIFSFICVLRPTRLGSESSSGVNAVYVILSLALELLPMCLVLVACIPLNRMFRSVEQEAQNVSSTNSFFNGIGFVLSDDETQLDENGNTTTVQGSSVM